MMRKISVVAALAVLVLAAASQPLKREINGARVFPESMQLKHTNGWVASRQAKDSHRMKVIVAIANQELKAITTTCDDVSDPRSITYGRYLSKAQLSRFVVNDAADRVHAWLNAEGVTDDAMVFTPNREFVRLSLDVATAARLFHARFDLYTHEQVEGSVLLRTRRWSMPSHMAEHVDFISGLSNFPSTRSRLRVASASALRGSNAAADSDPSVTPAFLATHYNISSSLYGKGGSKNTAAVAEFPSPGAAPEYYMDKDQEQFDSQYDLKNVNVKVRGESANKPGSCPDGFEDTCVEAMLDIEYLTAVARGISYSFWVTSQSGTNEPFVEWITDMVSDGDIELVQSISYGEPESARSVDELNRLNAELAKLCVQGISVLYASGDTGVAGSNQQSNCSPFNPGFPATSPYVTAVGATQVHNGEEVVCSTATGALITSSGGFSNHFEQPHYQADAVNAYLNTGNLPPAALYNASGRGMPDISAVGHKYQVVNLGNLEPVDGTSASTPTMAGIFALVNGARLDAGKPALGFANPTLYQAYARQASATPAFRDVTVGNNKCAESFCCDHGFNAEAGWDAATGLGVPDVGNLVALLS